MEIFRPKFPCTDGNLAPQIVKVSAGFELETFGLALSHSNHLTSVEELSNFYLTAILSISPFMHGNNPSVLISMEIFP
jgi:hypothetical protein